MFLFLDKLILKGVDSSDRGVGVMTPFIPESKNLELESKESTPTWSPVNTSSLDDD